MKKLYLAPMGRGLSSLLLAEGRKAKKTRDCVE